MVFGDFQTTFGTDKREALPRQCRECDYLFACNGECPKHRCLDSVDGEPGLNYLCAGYLQFFTHIDRDMRRMADLLGAGQPPAMIMQLRRQDRARFAGTKPNQPCPCDSGRKFKRCHGRR